MQTYTVDEVRRRYIGKVYMAYYHRQRRCYRFELPDRLVRALLQGSCTGDRVAVKIVDIVAEPELKLLILQFICVSQENGPQEDAERHAEGNPDG